MLKRTQQSNDGYKITFRSLGWGVGVGIGVSLLVSAIFYKLDSRDSFSVFLKYFGISFMYSFSYWGGTVWLVGFLNRKFDWLTRSKERIIWGIVGTLFVSFGITFFIHFLLLVVPGKNKFIDLFSLSAFRSYLTPAIINILISFWFHLQSFFVNWKKSALNEERLKSESALARLEALQQQLDPHFLFNAFNVLTGLIEEDQKLAQKFVAQLSKVYRYVLEMRSKPVVRLEDELEFAKSYLFLLKIRFENGFDYQLDIPEAFWGKSLVPVSIQLLIENAIKHNTVNARTPLKVRLYIDGNDLCVENNLNLKQAVPVESTGVGLANIMERYEMVNATKVPVIKQTEEKFLVKLPLIDG